MQEAGLTTRAELLEKQGANLGVRAAELEKEAQRVEQLKQSENQVRCRVRAV